MKAVIVEDELQNIIHLKAVLSAHCKQVTVIGEASNAEDGAKLIIETKPDLVLLDIQMPGSTGFEMLATLGNYQFQVIFITGYDEYAIQAIRCSALDYLVKPVVVAELINAVGKAESKINSNSLRLQIDNLAEIIRHPNKLIHKIVLPISNGHRLIEAEDIVYLKSSRSYTHFFMKDGQEILISKGMYLYEELLKPFGIMRCHGSYLVNLHFVQKFEREKTGYSLLLEGPIDLPVTSLYVPIIKQALNIRKLLPA